MSRITIFICLIFAAPIIFAQENRNSIAPQGQEAGRLLLSDEEVLTHMINLFHKNVEARGRAIKALAAMKDPRVVPALVEVLFFRHELPGWENAMRELTGQKLGADWPAWMEWLGKQSLEPHRVYPIFKSKIFGKIDPTFQEFLNPTMARTIRLDEVVWGGVLKDGIPALDHPKMIAAVEANYLDEEDEVFGVSVNGITHAYPLRIMNWHEMLNITIGGTPVSLSYCTLCGAAVLYETTASGKTYNFGSSGLLYRSNKLMYDRQTNTLWSSLRGEPVIGKLVGSGLKLKRLYVVRAAWREWRRLHPETLVLDEDTGFSRNYAEGAAYAEYFASEATMFPVAWRDKRLKAKDWIYGIILGGLPKAFPLNALQSSPIVNDRIADTDLVVIAEAKTLSVRAYERKGQRFVAMRGNRRLVDSEQNEWLLSEEKLLRVKDQQALLRLPGHLAYWFAWYAFFPNSEAYEAKP
jgi:hypothetical protein